MSDNAILRNYHALGATVRREARRRFCFPRDRVREGAADLTHTLVITGATLNSALNGSESKAPSQPGETDGFLARDSKCHLLVSKMLKEARGAASGKTGPAQTSGSQIPISAASGGGCCDQWQSHCIRLRKKTFNIVLSNSFRIYIYIYIHTRTYTYTCTYTYTYTYASTYAHIHTHTHIYIYICTNKHACKCTNAGTQGHGVAWKTRLLAKKAITLGKQSWVVWGLRFRTPSSEAFLGE